MSTPSTRSTGTRNNHDERLSAVEVEIKHFGHSLSTLGHRIDDIETRIDDGFRIVRDEMRRERQPVTAFAGWAAFILALVGAILWPLNQTQAKNEKRTDELESRELVNAYTRGQYDERFKTLKESINSAINNRKDIDAKHTAAAQRNSDEILAVDNRSEQRHQAAMAAISAYKDEVQHTIGNGLGERIREINQSDVERIIALERSVHGDPRNSRDIDRK